jgi:hypothetical protein
MSKYLAFMFLINSMGTQLVFSGIARGSASERVSLAEIRAYELEGGDLLFFTFSPERSENDFSSGGLPLTPKFMILCRVDKDGGIVSTHRVPWNLHLDDTEYSPKVDFRHVNGHLFCVVEGEFQGSSVFGKTPKAAGGKRLLRFKGLEGFFWVPEAELSAAAFEEMKENNELQRRKLGDWNRVETSRIVELKIQDDLAIRRTSLGGGGMLLQLHSEKSDTQFLYLYGKLSGIVQNPENLK